MDAASSTSELTNSSLRLDTRDRSRRIDAQFSSKTLISIHSDILQLLKTFRKLLIVSVVQELIVQDTCHGNTQQTLFLSVSLPDLTQIREASQRRLESSKDRCNSDFLFK